MNAITLLRLSPLLLALALPTTARGADTLASLREARQWTELRLEARAVLATAPADADAHAALVEALWRGGNLSGALAAAMAARQAGADSQALRRAEAGALALRGRWVDVSRLLSADAAAATAPPDTLLLAARALLHQERLDEARTLLVRLTQQEPSPAGAWLELARLELAARRPAAAQQALDRLPAARRDSVEALYLSARRLAADGDARGAVTALTGAISRAPLRASLYALRARQLANLQAWPEAARDIHSALLLGAGAAEDYLLACEAARMLEDNEALAAYARAGMAAHPGRTEFPLQLARALRALGDATPAVALLEKQLKDFPGNNALALELALAQAALGRQQDVVATLDGLLARQPSAQGYALRAYARLHLGELAQASEDAGNALVLEPGLANALLVQARVALARGEAARGESPCRQALARAPGLAWAYTTCSEVALALGKRDSARVLAEQALRLSPQDAEALRLNEQLSDTGARQ